MLRILANELGSRERRPHDPERVFQPGDFTKLYQQVINAVEILLRKGANPEAFRQAFQQLMADNPNINPESIKGIAKKGEDVLLTNFYQQEQLLSLSLKKLRLIFHLY